MSQTIRRPDHTRPGCFVLYHTSAMLVEGSERPARTGQKRCLACCLPLVLASERRDETRPKRARAAPARQTCLFWK